MRYFIIHKPTGVISDKIESEIPAAVTKTACRKRAALGLSKSSQRRLSVFDVAGNAGFPSDVGLVGRLDCESSGVMLMTDDGALGAAVREPPDECDAQCDELMKYKTKVYDVRLMGRRLYDIKGCQDALDELASELSCPFSFIRKNVLHHTTPADISILRYFQHPEHSRGGIPYLGWCVDVRIKLREGKNRQIRRIASRSKLMVLSLHRITVASILHVDTVPNPGDCRWLTQEEVTELYNGLQVNEKEYYNQFRGSQPKCL